MKKIAVYGKGGIGKSTAVSNISAAMAAAGLTVMQIGCDPKADSTRNLTGGKNIPTVLDTLRENGDADLDDLVVKSTTGIFCVESGGPAGSEILEWTVRNRALQILNPDEKWRINSYVPPFVGFRGALNLSELWVNEVRSGRG